MEVAEGLKHGGDVGKIFAVEVAVWEIVLADVIGELIEFFVDLFALNSMQMRVVVRAHVVVAID